MFSFSLVLSAVLFTAFTVSCVRSRVWSLLMKTRHFLWCCFIIKAFKLASLVQVWWAEPGGQMWWKPGIRSFEEEIQTQNCVIYNIKWRVNTKSDMSIFLHQWINKLFSEETLCEGRKVAGSATCKQGIKQNKVCLFIQSWRQREFNDSVFLLKNQNVFLL